MCRQQLINYKYARPEVDVWSAAAVMYYLLTLSPPRLFGKNNLSSPASILDMDPIPIREARPDIPKALADLLDTALDDSEFLCFRDAASFRQALKKVIIPT